jgi:hypothetical protein
MSELGLSQLSATNCQFSCIAAAAFRRNFMAHASSG